MFVNVKGNGGRGAMRNIGCGLNHWASKETGQCGAKSWRASGKRQRATWGGQLGMAAHRLMMSMPSAKACTARSNANVASPDPEAFIIVLSTRAPL